MTRLARPRRGGRTPGAVHIARLAAAAALVWGGLCFPAAAHAGAACSSVAPANITMTPLSPASITADGVTTATATVTLTDITGLIGVDGDASCLTVSSSDPAVHGSVVGDGNGTYTLSVVSSTTAHEVVITVTETTAGIAASQPLTLVHGPASSVVVTLGSGVLVANGTSSTTATISVSDAHGNSIAGDALVMSASDPGVRFDPVTDQGDGVYTTVVHGSTAPGSDTISATDISTTPATTGNALLTETPAPSLVNIATMQWTFYYARTFTVPRSLTVSGAPRGASITMSCSGRGCPFSTLSVKSGTSGRCSARSHRPCRAAAGLALTPSLAHRRLHPGARLTIAITRPGWIGKYYSFRIRAAAGPAIRISCLAPGARRPGTAC